MNLRRATNKLNTQINGYSLEGDRSKATAHGDEKCGQRGQNLGG